LQITTTNLNKKCWWYSRPSRETGKSWLESRTTSVSDEGGKEGCQCN